MVRQLSAAKRTNDPLVQGGGPPAGGSHGGFSTSGLALSRKATVVNVRQQSFKSLKTEMQIGT
jgi:hypothetical protein